MGVLTPGVYLVDQTTRKIYMEYLGHESMTVKTFLYQLGSFDHPILEQLVEKIATSIATMHSGESIHGDMTTSNMMIKPRLPLDKQMSGEPCRLSVEEIVESGDLGDFVSLESVFNTISLMSLSFCLQYLIDFGLSFVSGKIEDKAVDFYVLKRAFISTHPGSEELFEKIMLKYRAKTNKGLQIVQKFKEVELRGRKRECFG